MSKLLWQNIYVKFSIWSIIHLSLIKFHSENVSTCKLASDSGRIRKVGRGKLHFAFQSLLFLLALIYVLMEGHKFVVFEKWENNILQNTFLPQTKYKKKDFRNKRQTFPINIFVSVVFVLIKSSKRSIKYIFINSFAGAFLWFKERGNYMKNGCFVWRASHNFHQS